MSRKPEEEKPQTNTSSSRLVTLWQGLDAAGIMNLTFELDAIGLLVDASDSFLKLLGCADVMELVGHPFSELMFNEEDVNAFGDAVHKALIGHPSSLSCSVHYKGEPKAMLKVVLSSMQTEEEQTRVLCCAANISVREAKLSDAQAQLAVIHDIYATAELTLEGHFIDANAQFCRMAGMSHEALMRTHHADLCDAPDAPETTHRQLWKQVGKGMAVTGEYKRFRPDGSPYWIWGSYNPIVDLYGKAHKVVLYAKDITADKAYQADISGKINAIHRSKAMIEFSTQGQILEANENFLRLFDYQRDDVVGRHHRMFCDSAEAQSAHYLGFWEDLAKGKFATGEFKRLGRGGREVWIQASYNPIFDEEGKVCKIVKIAMDVTATKQRNAEFQSLIEALDRAQLLEEFDLSGHILKANAAFAKLVGYSPDELTGLHHRVLCAADFVSSPGYQLMWNRLIQGHHESGEFKRLAKDGQSIWIHATYHPVLDANGQVYKVVKMAQDITAIKQERFEHGAVARALDQSFAVAEFDLSGHFLSANEVFLQRLGFTHEQLMGQHHSLLCHAEDQQSHLYEKMWRELRQGQFHQGEYRRKTKCGAEVWFQASYSPVIDDHGDMVRIVKMALDITAQRQKSVENEGRIAAIHRSQAILDLDRQGMVQWANPAFLRSMGYQLNEVVGQHHSIFCSESLVRSPQYRDFWAQLSDGEFVSGRHLRKSRFNAEVWWMATYNPVFDADGGVQKITKVATDITSQVEAEARVRSACQGLEAQLESLDKGYQGALAHLAQTGQALKRSSAASQHAMSQIQQMADQQSAVMQEISGMRRVVSHLTELAQHSQQMAARVLTNESSSASDKLLKAELTQFSDISRAKALECGNQIDACYHKVGKLAVQSQVTGVALTSSLSELQEALQALQTSDTSIREQTQNGQEAKVHVKVLQELSQAG